MCNRSRGCALCQIHWELPGPPVHLSCLLQSLLPDSSGTRQGRVGGQMGKGLNAVAMVRRNDSHTATLLPSHQDFCLEPFALSLLPEVVSGVSFLLASLAPASAHFGSLSRPQENVECLIV
ncbi:hypothetical protein P7K49_027566 [Saguinus oedipus]|uniref:Uncharacterized protein n=1 Tax=Saguinus oedipus TaxID=9490 RepID=A0ABQ9U9T5_SAGOE|nr:hypothetical protein P7K49_027566 [Saguinus oedipus]